MAGLFKRGYEAAREEKQRQDKQREQLGKRLFRFFLTGDGDEATVRFLTEEPINFNEHTVKVMRGGKERFDTFLCDGSHDCPYCAEGDRPSFKGAFLIFDRTPFEVKDDKGKKKTVNGSVKLYVAGTRVLSQLDRLSSKYGLTDRDYEISRSGKGTSTTYLIERTDEVSPLTAKKIENMLPEKLREQFDGSADSLYSIIEEQLEMYLPDSDSTKSYNDDDEDDEDDSNEEYKSRKNLVQYDDDDEEDEDEDETPRKTTLKSKGNSSVKGLFKKKQ